VETVFQSNNAVFSFLDFGDECIVMGVEGNLIFFAGMNGTIIEYDMDHRRVHDIRARFFRYGRHNAKKSSYIDHTIFLMFPCYRMH
jgi:hypothetical protein